MPRSDRHRLRPVGLLCAARRRHRGDLDPRLCRRPHRRADVLGTDDRERAKPAAHRRAARGIHGLLRPLESRRHFRTRKELRANEQDRDRQEGTAVHAPGNRRRLVPQGRRGSVRGAVLLSPRQHAGLHAGGDKFFQPLCRLQEGEDVDLRDLRGFRRIAREIQEKNGLSFRASQRPGQVGLQTVRRHPGEKHVRQEVHGNRTQHFSHRREGRAAPGVAQGEGQWSRGGGLGSGADAVTDSVRPQGAAVIRGRQGKQERRIFVLDTNVLMHDPTAIFRFEEHDVYIPMTVLEELDAGKKGLSESARNVRQVSRFLDELMRDATKKDIDRGLSLPTAVPINDGKRPPAGRLYFQTSLLESVLPDSLPGQGADNAILANTLALQQNFPAAKVTLVSKDINLRIKAAIVGVHAEDYSSDKTIEDADLLVSGVQQLPANFWEKHGKGMESWQQQSRTFYRVRGPLVREWRANQFVYDPGENGVEAIVRKIDADAAVLELTLDYRTERNNVWGVNARNREQNLALNLLMDPEIDFVTVLGPAGTGKTLLTLAAGLAQTLDHNRFSEIIMTRVTIPLGEDIGFLPGTEEEKMEPWMGALMDNLEVLTQTQAGGTWGRGATNDLLRHRIKIRSLNFMRGRTFLNRFVIVDEAQNLTPKQMKALVTRAGPGTKMVCLGNIAQIDTPYLTETTTGLTYVVNRFHGWAYSGHITLMRGERSRLADYASEVL